MKGDIMGIPDVFEFGFNWFIGVGIFPIWNHSEYGKTLDVRISLPFFYVNIFFRKVKENNWI